MEIQPLGSRVFVKPMDPKTTTKSGIILTPPKGDYQSRHKELNTGIVVGVGPKVRKKFMVEVGQKVIYGKYGPQEIEVDGEKLLHMDEKDLFGVVS